MNNERKDTIVYSGKVAIELRNNKVNKTIITHNEGSLPLFYFLSNCLLGDFNAQNQPWYIQWKIEDGDWSNNYIPISFKDTISGNDSYGAKFSFTIPGIIIGEGNKVTNLRLHSKTTRNSQGSYLAEVSIDADDQITINNAQNTSLFIVWSLILENK